MADPFGILGLIGTVDAIYKWGKELVAACNALAQADSRLRDSIVRVEACWLKMQIQIEFVRKLEPQLSDWHKHVQQRILEATLLKLQAANVKLAGLIKKSNTSSDCLGERAVIVEARRFKYAFLRDSLAEAIGELEVWQGILDPSWFLMMKIAGPEVDPAFHHGAAAAACLDDAEGANSDYPCRAILAPRTQRHGQRYHARHRLPSSGRPYSRKRPASDSQPGLHRSPRCRRPICQRPVGCARSYHLYVQGKRQRRAARHSRLCKAAAAR